MLKNKSFLFTIGFLVLSTSATSFAQSVAQAGKQCSGELPISSISCINPDGGDDVRLYITEFQECKNGNIIKMDRRILGDVFREDMENYVESSTKVEFSSDRTHMDDRMGEVTLILPKSAEIKNGTSVYKIDVTNQVGPNYEGADITTDWHFQGSFKKLDSQGKTVKTGRMMCLVSI